MVKHCTRRVEFVVYKRIDGKDDMQQYWERNAKCKVFDKEREVIQVQ